MKDRDAEEKPAGVSLETKQAGDIWERWDWVEPSVWTERMLTALEEGVKGGKWFSLMDKVYAQRSLEAAFTRVRANRGAAGVDRQTIKMYEEHLEANLGKLARKLKEGSYQPAAIKRVWIPKPGSSEKRPLGIPTVQDRVVQTAMLHVLEPIFEKEYANQSYGFRPKRGCKDALRRVSELLEAGKTWVVDADLKSYFDTISHGPMMKRVEEKVADGRVLEIMGLYLKQRVMDGSKGWEPEEGTPQGAIISPLLSNIYLNPLDHEMARQGYEMVRYADDFVILCGSEEKAKQALAVVQQWVSEAELKLHPEKTRIVNAAEGGFDFLGYHFERGKRWPREKSLNKFRDTIRRKTRRTNKHSLRAVILDVNSTAEGWFGYFKHSYKLTFKLLDSWIRLRLRSLLRKRSGRKGVGRGRDHQRWTNNFFSQQGLFSLVAAYAEARQSSRR